MLITLLWGSLLSGAIVLPSLRLRFLTKSGGVGTFFIGTIIFSFGGIPWAIPLLLFFISSSLLSKLGEKKKVKFRAAFQKGEQRDLSQVLANGGLPALIALLFGLNGEMAEWLNFTSPQLPFYQLFLGSLAAATADTWATEIGLLSRKAPISLKNLRKVPPGTSGGFTLLGTFGALAGALLISLSSLSTFFSITVAGFLGSLIDSILGATLQAQYRCPLCGKVTEKRVHCQSPAVLQSGLSWMNNDFVNFLTTLTGALFVGILA
ncbi:DUF92 domain-containing protein [candidate division TA06 bacterium]|nr:DUF92 domain-containing protein [candidate division TA06 bacterium]